LSSAARCVREAIRANRLDGAVDILRALKTELDELSSADFFERQNLQSVASDAEFAVSMALDTVVELAKRDGELNKARKATGRRQ